MNIRCWREDLTVTPWAPFSLSRLALRGRPVKRRRPLSRSYVSFGANIIQRTDQLRIKLFHSLRQFDHRRMEERSIQTMLAASSNEYVAVGLCNSHAP